MSIKLDVSIDGQRVSPAQVEDWELRRARSVLPKLRRLLGLELRVAGCSAKRISEVIDDLMLNDTQANRQSNLLACPDHYLLQARGDALEVIETTGGSPFPGRDAPAHDPPAPMAPGLRVLALA
jgi:hypothetical protein